MGNLAITLGAQGKLEEAGVMQTEVLEKKRRILGEEHPHTISTTNSLATTLGGKWKHEEARMMQEVLGKRRTILEGQHISPLEDLLPSGWEPRRTSDGRTYFTNHDNLVDDGVAVRKAPRTGQSDLLITNMRRRRALIV